jgi:hypothetical protein
LPIEILLFQNWFFNFSMREQLYFLSLVWISHALFL